MNASRFPVLSLLLTFSLLLTAQLRGAFQAGAAKVDITPDTFPVIRNGGFIEAMDDRVESPLHARALVLGNEANRLALVIVDSCMVPLDVCDAAKELARQRTGLDPDHILIAATHTHSAPSVMEYCLGSRADPNYTKVLPGKIADAVAAANERFAPAQVGWARVDAGAFTANRRWIFRTDKVRTDPFGEATMHANMHPGYQQPDAVGESGPKDPWLSLLSVQTADGQPLAVLANFSMHYFSGHNGVSPDYFGLFCEGLAQRLAPGDPDFVGIMSQGTSGDLWWGDYSRPSKRTWSIQQYVDRMLDLADQALVGVRYQNNLPIGMAEERLTLNRRVPDAQRLAWARGVLEAMGDRRPQDRPEVYAEQAVYLHDNPTDDVVLQALRIGDIGITAMPNEVYALTGLKLKARSPLPYTFNIELANGASGYIPPPEQHDLGGYNTWPARTAGLEVQAEPIIVERILALLEDVSGQPRRPFREPAGAYTAAVLESKSIAYWRLGEMEAGPLNDVSGHNHNGQAIGRVAYFLPGPSSDALGSPHESRAIHLAGGHIEWEASNLKTPYTVEFWMWNGVPPDVRAVTGSLWSKGKDSLILTGTEGPSSGRLQFAGVTGQKELQLRFWHHVVLVREATAFRVHLDGDPKPDLAGPFGAEGATGPARLGRVPGREAFPFEGRLDEVAFYDRAMTAQEIAGHHHLAAVPLPDQASAVATSSQPADLAAAAPARVDGMENLPMSAADTMRRTHVAEGFRLEVAAAEPLVRDPVAIDWGSDGKLWVAEMADYPYGMDGQGRAGGRVRYLIDADRDGAYEQSQLFLEDLSFPTSVMAWRNGVLVTAAPDLLYAEDTDGDGKADRREVLFRGFIQGNQQLRVNSLRWGLDNWVHAASGGHHAGFGKETKIQSLVTGQEFTLGSRDFRFNPDEALLEPQSGPAQFGRVRDDWGNWFGVQNSFPLWHYVLDDAYLRRNPDVAAPDVRKQLRMPPNPRVYQNKPPQKRFHSFEQSGRFTSACGPTIYRDDLLFARAPGLTHAFTCEPFHNVVQHHLLRIEGPSFEGERADDGDLDFFASADRWCRPVMSRTGPDGALYVVDMYRYMIEHPDWLPQGGRDELKPFYRSGENYGRIYRIVPASGEPRDVPRLAGRPTAELVQALGHSNGLVRDLAHRELLRRPREDVVPGAERWVRGGEDARVRLQSLCVLDGLRAVTPPLLKAALQDGDPAVRRAAVRLAEEPARHDAALMEAVLGMVNDPEAWVRLQLACTLGQWDDPRAGQALAHLALHVNDDPFFNAAILSSAVPHYQVLLGELLNEPRFTRALLAMACRDQARRDQLLDFIQPPPGTVPSLLHFQQNGMFLAVMREQNLSWTALDDRARSRLGLLALVARSVCAADSATVSLQVAAMGLLGFQDADIAGDTRLLAGLLQPNVDAELQEAALATLASWNWPEATRTLLALWNSYPPRLRMGLVDLLFKNKTGTRLLLEEVAAQRVVVIDLSPAHRQQLLEHPDKEIAARAQEVLRAESDVDRQALLETFQPALKLAGREAAGRTLFQDRCATCHQLGDLGTAIGPDLRSLSDRSGPALLSAILDPNQNVEPTYLAYTATLRNDQTVYGLIASETGNSVIMKTLDGQTHQVLRKDIQSLTGSRLSFMPEGLEAGMTPQDMADLITFVQGALRPNQEN